MGNHKSEIDRKIENELLVFTENLKRNMTEKDVVALYEQLEADHWLVESKILLMRTIFHGILSHQKNEGGSPFPEDTGAFA
jgi:hypothetical protein